MRKKTNKLENYIGSMVSLTLYGKAHLCGELHKVDSDEFLDRPELHSKTGYYTLTYPHSNTRIGEYVFSEKAVSDLKLSTVFES